MIELHDLMNRIALFEPGTIVVAYPRQAESAGSSVKTRDGEVYLVKETVSEIRDMLEAADAGDETPESKT